MPTYGDETLHERYQREHADHLARLAKMTPEQIAEMAMSLHNALAEADRLRTQLKVMSCDSEASAYIPVDRQTGERWPPQKHKGSGKICDYIPLFKRQLAVDATPAAPVEIEYPTYHAQGMGCGLEDRGITDRYEAMAYGFQEAVEQMVAIINSMGPLYSSPCADGKLTKPAKVGAVRFQPGVSERQVVEAAQRLHEFEVTPEKEALRLAQLVSVVNAIHYQPKPAIRIELVSASPGSGLHIRQWSDLAGLEPGTYELYLPVQP